MTISRLLKSHSGAALLEYTIIIGLIAILTVSVIWIVADHVGERFSGLREALQIEPAAGAVPTSGNCAVNSQGLGDEKCTSGN